MGGHFDGLHGHVGGHVLMDFMVFRKGIWCRLEECGRKNVPSFA